MSTVKPIRIQRTRAKGGGMKSPNALPVVYVGRPSRWGNPMPVRDGNNERAVSQFRMMLEGRWDELEKSLLAMCSSDVNADLVAMAIMQMQVGAAWMLDNIGELRGKNLSCWCPIGSACHADALLEIANAKDGAR